MMDTFTTELLQAIPGLSNYCKRLAKADWEDLVQDTVVQALKGKDGFEPGTNMKGWLTIIARNSRIGSQRKSVVKNKVSWDDTFNAILTTPPDQFNKLYAKQTLQEIAKLQPMLRDALMSTILGETNEEHGNQVGVIYSTAKVRVFRGRQEMAKRFGEPQAKRIR